jgi:hypothetical protein
MGSRGRTGPTEIERGTMKFSKLWKIVLAAYLILLGLGQMDVLDLDATILGIVGVVAGALVLIDR